MTVDVCKTVFTLQIVSIFLCIGKLSELFVLRIEFFMKGRSHAENKRSALYRIDKSRWLAGGGWVWEGQALTGN